MLIDWFTVGAQLLNFLILVWLMKRFLYQPVLDAIAAREQRIAAELSDAATTRAEAMAERDAFRRRNEHFDAQRAELLRQARAAATADRERLQREAREAADAARAQRAVAWRSDMQNLHAAIARETQRQVFDISRRVLGDLAGMGLEQRICEVFIQRLQALEGPALATLGAALEAMSEADPARLRSSFELPAAQRAAVQSVLDARFGQPIPLAFEVIPDLVSGIELSTRGHKLAWSVEGYLSALSRGLEPLLPQAEDSGHPA